jgi:adenine-specific DNA-methyltransferase
MNEENYFKKQILTYMGNKRKYLSKIDEIITLIKKELDNDNISIGEGFSGSGIVSRLFKNRVIGDEFKPWKTFYVNDISGYSKTLNECYLTSTKNLSTDDFENLILHSKKMQAQIKTTNNPHPFVAKYWAPQDDNDINPSERVYFTAENAKIIDQMLYYIHNFVEDKYKSLLLAPLIVQCSIHNNTNGQFSAYYKDEKKEKGMYGGKKSIDLNRIKGKIKPLMPYLTQHQANVKISQLDVIQWLNTIPEVDLMYYDPPYNKHPYNIYYFLLDIINDYNLDIEIPDTYRGQPKNWIRSNYCSYSKAKREFETLIENTKAKYILISYNNKGIIPIKELDKILMKKGELFKIPFENGAFNKYLGIAAKKRQKKEEKVEEFLWLVDCR